MVSRDLFSQLLENQRVCSFQEVLMCLLLMHLNYGISFPAHLLRLILSSQVVISTGMSRKTTCSRSTISWYHLKERVKLPTSLWRENTIFTRRFSNSSMMARNTLTICPTSGLCVKLVQSKKDFRGKQTHKLINLNVKSFF